MGTKLEYKSGKVFSYDDKNAVLGTGDLTGKAVLLEKGEKPVYVDINKLKRITRYKSKS